MQWHRRRRVPAPHSGILCLLAALVIGSPPSRDLSAQSAQGTAVIAGVVVDSTGAFLEGARITLGELVVRADARGAFRLPGVSAGAHEVVVQQVGYAPQTFQATLAPNDTLYRRIILTRVVALDSVVVAAPRSRIPEFDERRSRGGGQFITREELDKHPVRKLSDVLRRVPGMRIVTNPRNRGEAFAVSSRGVITMRGSNPTCYVHVYVDDVAVFSGSPQPPFDLATLSALEIEGVEYYSGGGSIPAKYNRTGSACGVLLIWTRR